MQKITNQTYEQTLKAEKLVAEINELTAKIEQLRQRIVVLIPRK